MPGMIYQLLYRPDGTMNFLYVSDACAKIYGLSREEIMQDALTVRRAVDQQDLSSFEETIQEATKRLSTWIWEGRIYNAQTKSTRWLRGVSQPERLPGGETVWNGIMIDITDQKESEIKLKQNEERLKFALEASNDGLFDMNVVKAIMYYSPRFIEMLGYTGNESDLKYTSGEFIDFIHPDDQDRIMPDLQEAILSAQPWNAEYRLRTRSGEYVWFNVRGRTQLNEFDKPLRFAGFITDITERKQVEQAKTEFVSIASHQLRTPLTAINWYIEMLLDGSIGKCSKEQKEYLQQIYSSNRRMVDLVNSLLNVSRIDMGTFAIDPEPTDFVEISKSVVMELQPQIVTKHLIVNEEYRGSIPIINADPKLVRIIFQNLVSNAVKYTPEKGNVIIKIEVGKPIVGGKKIAKDMLMITVSDTGYGIPKNQQSHIFSKLFRADNAREKVAEGTGLGLYIVKSIIEAANGKIWFESEENKGTTFYAILPLGGMSKKAGTKGLS
jgi:PAS domain S-box-containing protein